MRQGARRKAGVMGWALVREGGLRTMAVVAGDGGVCDGSGRVCWL